MRRPSCGPSPLSLTVALILCILLKFFLENLPKFTKPLEPVKFTSTSFFQKSVFFKNPTSNNEVTRDFEADCETRFAYSAKQDRGSSVGRDGEDPAWAADRAMSSGAFCVRAKIGSRIPESGVWMPFQKISSRILNVVLWRTKRLLCENRREDIG